MRDSHARARAGGKRRLNARYESASRAPKGAYPQRCKWLLRVHTTGQPQALHRTVMHGPRPRLPIRSCVQADTTTSSRPRRYPVQRPYQGSSLAYDRFRPPTATRNPKAHPNLHGTPHPHPLPVRRHLPPRPVLLQGHGVAAAAEQRSAGQRQAAHQPGVPGGGEG